MFKDKRPLRIEEKIEEHKAFLRDFQRLTSHEWLEQIGGVATIDRQLIMIDALVTTARTELQQNFNTQTLADYLYAVFNTVRDNRSTSNSSVLEIEAEYLRRGGTHLNEQHNVLFYTVGSFYEHMSGKELSTSLTELSLKSDL